MKKCTNADGNDAVMGVKYSNTDYMELCGTCYQIFETTKAADPEAFGTCEVLTLLPTAAELAG